MKDRNKVSVKDLVRRVGSSIWDQFESWGLRIPQAGTEMGPQVRMYGPGKGGEPQLIGVLSQERGKFVFRYHADYIRSPDAQPISPFPDLNEEYVSPELCPFFAVRIPPAERSDVRDALAKHGLRSDQTLEVLGTMAKRSISNPYQLDLKAN